MKTCSLLLSLALAGLNACSPGPDDSAPAREREEIPWEPGAPLLLTPEQERAAGIRTVVAGPKAIEDTLLLSGTVSENLDAQAHINPKVPGLVRKIYGHLGQTVQEGDPLCELESVGLGEAVGNYLLSLSTFRNSEETLKQETVLLDRALSLAEAIYKREKDLSARAISTKRFLYDAEKAFQDASLERDRRILELQRRLESDRADLAVNRNRLLILGIPAERIDTLEDGGDELQGIYRIRAPRSGVIVDRHITEGEFVSQEQALFKIQDLSTVWVLASAYEENLEELRIGAKAQVVLDAFPGSSFPGKVDFIDYQVERSTRSMSIRILLENHGIERWPEPYPLRPGMFGEVKVTSNRWLAPVVLPEATIVHDIGGDLVFVKIGPGRYEVAQVEVSKSYDGSVEVLSGLEGGAEVVVAGTFQLKSILHKSELGEEE